MPAPWGDVSPPAELPVVPGKPVVHGAEAPGEALRRQARELIDNIPAIDLPSALAFLEFLKQRGADAMGRHRAGDDDESTAEDDPRRAAS